MARQNAISVTNNFVKGLVTTATPLQFPDNACTDTDNCVFNLAGDVTRRPSIDVEDITQHRDIANGSVDGGIYTEYVWKVVGGDGTKSWLVQQVGSSINFYDISTSLNVSANLKTTAVDLTAFVPSGSTKSPASFECQYAQGNGFLFISNPAIDPIYVTYNPGSDTVTATVINLQIRDLFGIVPDEADDGTRVAAAAISNLTTSSPKRYYNLSNQGWQRTDALSQWDAARTDTPSNYDYTGLFRASPTDSFDPTKVGAVSPGNGLAPKGFFLLNPFVMDRSAALTAAGLTTVPLGNTSFPAIGKQVGTVMSANINNAQAAFNSVYFEPQAQCATKTLATTPNTTTTLRIGKDLGTAIRISRCDFYAPSNAGFFTAGILITFNLFGSNTGFGVSGTLLGTFANTLPIQKGQSSTIVSTDQNTAWRYLWLDINIGSTGGGVETFAISEIDFFAINTSTLTNERPACVAFFGDRLFYGGVNDANLAGNIYFSQIIQTPADHGKCYQLNDPTDENVPDLESSDGGFIKIPDMGVLRRLYNFRSSLIVFATNGVWIISGSNGATFKATDYVIQKVTSIGMRAQNSVVDFKSTPLWWAEDGIYTLVYDPNYNSYDVKSLTLNVIGEFYHAIPAPNRQFVKGVYHTQEQTVYWLYNDSPDLLPSDFYKYNRVLILNGFTNAFYPWTFPTAPNLVRGVTYAVDAQQLIDPLLKFTTTTQNGTTLEIRYSDLDDTLFADWSSTTPVDFNSFFITGYRLDGQTQKNVQANYVYVFMDAVPNSSCLMQGIFDFNNNLAGSEQQQVSQQIFNPWVFDRSVTMRRLKVRGSGRSIQLKFSSESGKPFSIIGWSMNESTNSGI